jgi:hypothetical protein
VLFDIETDPYTLFFGVKRKNYAFRFSVERGFVIKPWIDDKEIFGKLYEILQLTPNSKNRFSLTAFLKDFDRNAKINNIREAKISDRRLFFKNVDDEADKIFFLKWLPHGERKKVSPENLEKTRKWLGEDAYNYCKKKNTSSCWTANEDEGQDEMPELPL